VFFEWDKSKLETLLKLNKTTVSVCDFVWKLTYTSIAWT